MSELTLKSIGEPISPLLKESFLGAVAEYQSEGRYGDLTVALLSMNFGGYIHELVTRQHERSEARVPEDLYWAVIGDKYVGRISLRHELNRNLAYVGGHIGYEVRPSMRGQGHATEMLRQCLVKARARKLRAVLITCDESNLASRRVIENNGGECCGKWIPATGEATKLHFWIRLS